MTLKIQITSNPLQDILGGQGGDIISQLSGLISQGQALSSAGVGLPGLQSIGSQIAALGPAIASAGGTGGIDGVISSLGTQMTTATMPQMSGILSSLSGQLSSLTSMLNPSGDLSSVLHTHILDKLQGIVHSAFQGQHTIKFGQGGLDLTSVAKVAHTAPQLPHNGFTLISDALAVTKGITAQSFGMLSDGRLKDDIQDHPPVLEKVLRLRLKTFLVKALNWETGEVVGEIKPRRSIGFIAQQVRKIFPQLVRKDGKYLVLEEEKLGPIMVAALQEFVAETRAEIASLRQEIAELKAR